MKQLAALTLLSAVSLHAAAQQTVSGLVREEKTAVPLETVVVTLLPSGERTMTDEQGRFQLRPAAANTQIQFSSIGHETLTLPLADFLRNGGVASLRTKTVQLSEVKVSSGAGEQYKPISRLDINLRGVNNSQEVLRMVPGLFIGQHAGGGKAEQIFLRGFDLDHGTDINIGVDGMPVNMVSHAHGQGYADLHFLIPELIDNVSFKKGTYYAEKGNFTTTGFVDFKTLNALPENLVKVEAGMYNTFRGLGLFDLLGTKVKARQQSAFIASEYMFTQGYFSNPQDFHRVNLFGKYYGALGAHHTLSISASTFSSRWDASGQIPERAVESGLIGYYGAIDPNEGGNTSRTNVNAQLTSRLSDGSYFRNQVYYSHYRFGLFSNFTFYKEDPVNGDQIRQAENRHLAGYNGSYHKTLYLGRTQLSSEAGVNIRLDRTNGSELSRTRNRAEVTAPLMLGDIAENNLAAYLNETLRFSNRWSLNAGLRYDYFRNRYTGKLSGGDPQSATADILSPKLSLYYHPNDNLQLYLSSGKGFHSNDTRVVVAQNGLQILPAAYGTDLGTVWKPAKNLLVNAALWYLWLDQEFVYVGDEGVVEPSGKSRRLGADLSLRYQPVSWLYADVDLNYSHGRAVEEAKGENYLPLAPRFTSIGGLTVKTKRNLSASLRYRYMGDRPATEDYSTVAEGYFVVDANLGYVRRHLELGLSIQNLLNTRWKETQFYTESRLFNEPAAVGEIHFTPGIPFFARLSVAYRF